MPLVFTNDDTSPSDERGEADQGDNSLDEKFIDTLTYVQFVAKTWLLMNIIFIVKCYVVFDF